MADIRDWGRFVRGRWDWSKFGYERGFPRGCQFTDIDAAIEFDGKALVIEPKHYDGDGPLGLPPTGQLLFLKAEVRLGKTVLVLYGCGVCNDPYAVYDVGREEWFQWRDQAGEWLSRSERRKRLKNHIDRAMGLSKATNSTELVSARGNGDLSTAQR